MAKARVYELAKELGVGNKEILEQLKKKNVEVKNHMSTVEDNVAEKSCICSASAEFQK